MHLMCRFGRHSPLRDKQLIDMSDMRQETACKRCGAPMERQAGTPWRVQLQPIPVARI
jgi:hypothetical protein